ncbi:catalytic core domain of acetyl xylan esterase from Trichoderma Reesei [Hyaloscypha sp. PMI_1271]|nr:catalytic core domain of acetyl xylan esterase from Trichoderma Reesei [Hyaloscypha sp. PMI_1271]
MLVGALQFLESRHQYCPNVHVFDARETTVPQSNGFGSSGLHVDMISSRSWRSGYREPDTQIVLLGYSQGAQSMDDVMCGGGDPAEQITNNTAPVSAAVAARVKGVILMGNPSVILQEHSIMLGIRRTLDGQIGTAFAEIIQSYCDAADLFYSKGSDPVVHQEYPKEYGSQALAFV